MIAKFPARNGEPTPLKKNASVQQTASHQEKKQVSSEDKLSSRKGKRGKKESSSHASGITPASQCKKKKLDISSDVRLTEQPKLKKKPPPQVARDRSRRKAFWKRTQVARKLSAENWVAHYARLQETKSVASPQVPVVSHPEKSGACLESTHFVSETTKVASPQVSVDSLPVNSGACLEPTFFDLEPKRHLTIEELQPDLNKLCAKEAESEQSDSDIDSPSACGNCLKDGGQFPRFSGCKYVQYCSTNCLVEDWPSHKQLCRAIQTKR